MMKKISALILTAVMLLGVIVLPATAANAELPFGDVPHNKWYYNAVKTVYRREIMNGLSSDTFGPNQPMTRGQFVTILARVSSENVSETEWKGQFPDTRKDRFYSAALEWCVENGLIKGYPDGTFRPDNPILRQEFATVFVRFLNYKGLTINGDDVSPGFKDASTFPKFAKDAIETLRLTGLVKGDTSGNFNPKNSMTRAEIAQVIARFGDTDVMNAAFDAFFDKYICPTHSNTLHMAFCADDHISEEEFGAVLLDAMGLDSSKYRLNVGNLDSLNQNQPAIGDGQINYTLAGPVRISVTNLQTGLTTHEWWCDVWARKLLRTGVNAMYVCSDRSEMYVPAEASLDALICKDETHGDGEYIHALFPNESYYTEENIANAVRTAVGVDKNVKVRVLNYKTYLINSGEPVIVYLYRKLGNGKVEMTRTYQLICSTDGRVDAPVLTGNHAEFDVVDKMYGRINEVLLDVQCATHGLLDVQFGGKDTLTEENLNAFLADTFDLGEKYKVEVDHDTFVSIKTEYSGGGNGDSVWKKANVTITNTVTGESTVAEVGLGVRKDLYAQYTGAVETYALSYCMEDRPTELVDALNAMTAWEEETLTLPEEQANLEGIEAYFREVTGFENEEFYSAWFDPDAVYEEDGSEIIVLFKYYDPEEGRTYTVSAKVTVYNSGSSTYLPH